MSDLRHATAMNNSNAGPRSNVSIVIKTLNEEKNIARAIESALAGLEETGGEVIVADSASTDRTVEIAASYPITVVQLANPSERCCGIGPQLGYQYAQGRFVYILDGDMQLRPGFLKAAVEFLDQHPRAGGVAGLVVEHNLDSLEFQARVERGAAHMKAGQVDRLDMGGLYRREAVEQVGHFSDRNLHSYEELDLAVRLRTAGWTLHRIDTPAVDHFGHDMSPYRLLQRRWKSHYIDGIGEVVRAASGKPHQALLLRELRELHLYLAFAVWLVAVNTAGWALTAQLQQGLLVSALSIATPWLALSLKKRSLSKGSYATVSLLMHLGGLLRGLLAPRTSMRPVASIERARQQPSQAGLKNQRDMVQS